MADDVAGLSYEAAMRELDAIIDQLERGDIELEAAITAYERGAALTRHCAALLDRTEQKVSQLVVGAAGEVERPFQAPRAERPAAVPPSGSSAEERLFGAEQPPRPPAPRGRPVDPDAIPF